MKAAWFFLTALCSFLLAGCTVEQAEECINIGRVALNVLKRLGL